MSFFLHKKMDQKRMSIFMGPSKAIAFDKNVFGAMRIWVAKAIWEFRNMNRVWQFTARNLGGSF